MSETTDTITLQLIDGCGIFEKEIEPNIWEPVQVPIRVMTPEEIKERLELNQANTTEAVRNRVLEQRFKSNGKSNGKTHKEGSIWQRP